MYIYIYIYIYIHIVYKRCSCSNIIVCVFKDIYFVRVTKSLSTYVCRALLERDFSTKYCRPLQIRISKKKKIP